VQRFPAVVLSLAAVISGCGGEESPTERPQTPVATASPEASAEFAPVAPEQGGTYFGVYVAIAKPGDEASLQASAEALDAIGISEYSIGDISCDEGAAEELGVPKDSGRVAVYFTTREEADAFTASLPSPILRIARVKTFCLD
jgi:hypothetical protein